MPILFAFLAFVSTFLGGLVGIRFKDKFHLILGFTAGVLLGVVAFDIFPEIVELLNQTSVSPRTVMVSLVVGFLFFHILEKVLLMHHAHEEEYGHHHHPSVGVASALALIGHSVLDGVGIGLGFQVSTGIGLVVALAVISHDFSDGLNTVSLLLRHKNTTQKAIIFLIFDSLAPIIGAYSTILFTIADNLLVVYLGFFAGFLLYIGAADILPEAHAKHSSYQTIAMTILGVVFIYIISSLI